MKSKILVLFFLISFLGVSATSNDIFSDKDSQILHLNMQKKKQTRLLEPIVLYDTTDNNLTINFENTYYFDYSVTISSPFTDVDYYVTSSYTTIPLVVDGISDYTIIIKTSDGDVFEGTLAASEYSTTVTM